MIIYAGHGHIANDLWKLFSGWSAFAVLLVKTTAENNEKQWESSGHFAVF
jgi:hypothetical protein